MQARYTQGPDELTFGHPDGILFKRGEWREVDAAHRQQLTLPDRVAEYGIEVSDAAAETPAAEVPADRADPLLNPA